MTAPPSMPARRDGRSAAVRSPMRRRLRLVFRVVLVNLAIGAAYIARDLFRAERRRRGVRPPAPGRGAERAVLGRSRPRKS
jgi:hypothetical protein